MNPRQKAIQKADGHFSKYIRLLYADDNGLVRCCTSGSHQHVTKIQCGHYMSRKHLNTRWTIENCAPQSVSDNIFGQGEAQKFAVWIDDKFGKGTAEKMRIKALARGTKFSTMDIEFIADHWKEQYEELEKLKGKFWK